EYVYSYAYSDTNMSIASSSSNAPLINHTRATNENFLSPQSNRSVMSSQNNQDTIMTDEFNQSNQSEKNTRLSVKLHPIICWNMDEQKYFFSNPSLCSTFSNNVKVVGFIGTKKSGRTTAIHSLLFELGYYLT